MNEDKANLKSVSIVIRKRLTSLSSQISSFLLLAQMRSCLKPDITKWHLSGLSFNVIIMKSLSSYSRTVFKLLNNLFWANTTNKRSGIINKITNIDFFEEEK